MKVCEHVHQIKIDFNVTPEIKRYVYVYLITGDNCYLIDSGVAGSEKIIEKYMQKLGRDISEINAIFLTHAHPDHIGAASAIQKKSGCRIYASDIEKIWMEDIDLQFKERPIPNFYTLVKKSVKVDNIVKESDRIVLEDNLTLEVLETPGHSRGEVSYMLKEEGVFFCGDVIPVPDDFPIFVDVAQSKKSIEKIMELENIRFCCPAWDKIYFEKEINKACHSGLKIISALEKSVKAIDKKMGEIAETDISNIGISLGLDKMSGNPLFRKSIEACLEMINFRIGCEEEY